MRRLPSILVALAVAACSESSLTAPTPPTPNISGNWSGTVSSLRSGDGEVTLALSQTCLIALPPGSGCFWSIVGTWKAAFANPAANDSGSAEGQISVSTLTLSLNSASSGKCSLILSATVPDSTAMQGTYAAYRQTGMVPCTGTDSGTVAAAKTQPTAQSLVARAQR